MNLHCSPLEPGRQNITSALGFLLAYVLRPADILVQCCPALMHGLCACTFQTSTNVCASKCELHERHIQHKHLRYLLDKVR